MFSNTLNENALTLTSKTTETPRTSVQRIFKHFKRVKSPSKIRPNKNKEFNKLKTLKKTITIANTMTLLQKRKINRRFIQAVFQFILISSFNNFTIIQILFLGSLK